MDLNNNANGRVCRDGDKGKQEGQEDTRNINKGQCATHMLPLLSSGHSLNDEAA